MFESARIKLTSWYLLIIMLISLSFSVAMYRVLASELDRVERIQKYRTEYRLGLSLIQTKRPVFDPELIDETKSRLLLILIGINFGILSISSLAGYFLAGRTLKPIRQMMDEQNRFITDSSHELRTPLTSLKSEIEVNLRDNKLTLAEAKKLLKSNLEEVNNLQYLSDNLIKLTQYQKNNDDLNTGKVSLLNLVNDAIKKVEKLAKGKNIAIENRITEFELEIDKQSLVEVFVIFLDNAIKYSRKNTSVTLTSRKVDNSLVIEIADHGMGISEKDMPFIFDRFYRADQSRTKTETQGYGLGLSIAKKIIEKNKGFIKVKSEAGKGTVFTIFLSIKK